MTTLQNAAKSFKCNKMQSEMVYFTPSTATRRTGRNSVVRDLGLRTQDTSAIVWWVLSVSADMSKRQFRPKCRHTMVRTAWFHGPKCLTPRTEVSRHFWGVKFTEYHYFKRLYTENAVWFLKYTNKETNKQINKQTYRHADHNISHPTAGEVTSTITTPHK